MNKITLHRLSLRNFKGFGEFDLILNGSNATISGDNGTGKTTLMDAFLWLLFDKDSQGKKDFQLKTVDKDGQEIHNLEHSVEAELTINGETLTLSKCLKEKWTKKRGELHPEFSGHTTDYSVDGVPVKQKDWQDRIGNIVQEETFRLLTNPLHFNSLKWQDRRALLLQVCGDISDADVVKANSELKGLSAILGSKRTVDEHKAVIKSRQKAINDRLREIPARIDELNRGIEAVSDYDRDEITKRIKELEQQIQEVKATGNDAALRQERSNLLSKFYDLGNKRKSELVERNSAHDTALLRLKQNLNSSSTTYGRNLKEQGVIQERINSLTNRLTAMRAEYKAYAAQDNAVENTCPTCGQGLPEDQVKAAIAKANETKAQALEANKREGMAVKAAWTNAQEELATCIEATNKAQAETERLQAEIKVLEENQPSQEHDLDAKIEQINGAIVDLNIKIEKAANSVGDTSGLEIELGQERTKLAGLDAAETSKTRIAFHEAEEKRLSAEYERLAGELYLCEKFMVRKVEMMNEVINSKFKMARFKMFDEQINGGLAETCITMVNGVPYGRGLNRGNEINVGLDIVDTLSGHYEMSCPVFIDNSESVTRLYGLGSQMIKLRVQESAKSLTVTLD